ncbi:MAG TPA: xanthine dehydrogenase family protein molybdopterin-binding subunit [Stellaceae bacterium]|jgi:carbon-monoxide dehydrogenase large subunit|nr:xanthine dehydrogenase family protein molybdopterin-binding subunit [Stellaceae bacterium]
MDGDQIGRSLRRFEDERFLRGRGRYVDDSDAAGQLHAVVLRSPHGHALIEGIETAAAAALPGVRGIFTAADLDADGIGELPCIAQVATVAPMIVPPRPALARGRVRHVGDAVALIVADTRDAAERVVVNYRDLAAVVDGPAALAADAPLLWDQAPGNLCFRFERGDKAAVAAAFAAAAHVVELSLVNNRLVVMPVEPRAAVGRYEDGRFDLLVTGQGVHSIRQQLADAVFHVPAEQVRVSAPDVGGGFGVKNFLYPEYVLVLWAARRLRQPVRFVAEAGEEFVAAAQARDNATTARLALDGEGRFLALDVDTIANLGAYLSTSGPGSSTNSPATAMGGVYNVPAVFMAVRGVFTNTVPIDAYRGAGKPEANYLTERLIELAARRLGLDPVELRRRNVITAFPHRSALGINIDCGRFADNIEETVRRSLAAGFAARRAEAASRGRLRGLGVASFLETSRGAPGERAEIRFAADRKVELVVGTQSNGQGHETSFPQIAADLLGLPLEAFRFVQADTRTVKSGNGHGGARSMHMGGTALALAAEQVIEKGKIVAAHLLQAEPGAVHFAAGRFETADGRGIDLLDVAVAAADPANLPEGMAPGLDGDGLNLSDLFTFPSGCHAAEVEIDPDTGLVTLVAYTAVDDYGRLVNPLITAGQVHGGVAQGIGQAMLEHTVYEAGTGQLLSGSLMDYALPRAGDLPAFDLTLVETPTKSNPLGVKGSGQAGCIAAPQTITHAVLDALAPLGVTHIDMPATPERVWRAMRAAAR